MSILTIFYAILLLSAVASSCLALNAKEIMMIREVSEYVEQSRQASYLDVLEVAVKATRQSSDSELSLVPDTLQILLELRQGRNICVFSGLVERTLEILEALPRRNGKLGNAILERVKDYKKQCEPIWINEDVEIGETLDGSQFDKYLEHLLSYFESCKNERNFKCLVESRPTMQNLAVATLKAMRDLAKIYNNQELMNALHDTTGDEKAIRNINFGLIRTFMIDCDNVVKQYEQSVSAPLQVFHLLGDYNGHMSESFWEKATAYEYCLVMSGKNQDLSRYMAQAIQSGL